MSDGPRIPQFSTKPGYVYVGEIDVGLMAAIDAQVAKEATEREVVTKTFDAYPPPVEKP